MKRLALSLALTVCVSTVASAQAAIESAKGKWALSGSSRISHPEASKTFGTTDLEAFCFFPGDRRYGATILRAGTSFFALNGNGRTHATGAIVTWRGSKYRVHDEGFGTDRGDVLGSLVPSGNTACQ